MALQEGQYLIVHQGQNKTFLLLRNGRLFHLVSVDRRLTEEKEEKLLTIYPCSDAALDELGLNIQRVSPRGVAVTGCEAGDTLCLYSGKKKQKYTLSDDSTPDAMDTFLDGIPRFTAPQTPAQKKNGQDWRKINRDSKLYHQLRFVVPVLVILMTVFSVGYLLNQTWKWYLGCLVCLILPVVLDIVLPSYFTLMLPARGKESNAWELGWVYFVHLTTLILFHGHNWLNEDLFFLVWGIIGGGAVLILGLFAEEFRRRKAALFAVFFLVGILGTFVVGHVNEAFDFSEPQTYILTVQDLKNSSGRKNVTYKCVVTLPDGRQAELETNRDTYMNMEVGQYVLVEHSVGALGIEYANVFPVE